MIKPFFPASIDIKDLKTYLDFFKKKPKRARKFSFSMSRSERGMEIDRYERNRIQLRLLRVSRLLKSVSKVDFRGFGIEDHDFWKAKLISVWKKNSHAKTLQVMSLKNGPKIKSFKYFSKLNNLIYDLGVSWLICTKYYEPDEEDFQPRDFLKFLKYCPNIHSFYFFDHYGDRYFPKAGINFRRYFKTLEYLVLRSEGSITDEFECPIELCRNLRSISLGIENYDFWKSLPQIMKAISELSHLQQISLHFISSPMRNFVEAFRKITQKGLLQKVALSFQEEMSDLGQILETLMDCKLTHFSLKACFEEGLLNSISQLVKSMDQLESLELCICNRNRFSKDHNLLEICGQIGKLQALRNLTMDFQTSGKALKSARVPNFIPCLQDIFTKQIKIETFHLECNQLDPEEALKSLISLLESSTLSSLTHLRVNAGALSCSKKMFQSLLELFKHLLNIQVLEIPCLGVKSTTSSLLKEMAVIINDLKYLRVFEIGEMERTVKIGDFYQFIEAIGSKRGLRKFDCSISKGFQKSLEKKTRFYYLDIQSIREKNPYLETLGEMNNMIDDFYDEST